MTAFNVQVQLDLPAARLSDELADQLLEHLAGFHPALSNEQQLISARISLPATGLVQATQIAVSVVEQAAAHAGAPATTVAVHAMTEEEFLAREGWNDAPGESAPEPTVTIKEAAAMLQITRQAVAKRTQLPAGHPEHLRGRQDSSKRWHVLRVDVRRAMLRRGLALSSDADEQTEVLSVAADRY
ncbi:hypothetical protein [Kineococcus sp. SYSU DK005]|uniref:hypothetical protein n=1 Tax=Kineococcus sp. SYSU DK005 TaxID=3383126 RepID=UPI003D7C9DF7